MEAKGKSNVQAREGWSVLAGVSRRAGVQGLETGFRGGRRGIPGQGRNRRVERGAREELLEELLEGREGDKQQNKKKVTQNINENN